MSELCGVNFQNASLVGYNTIKLLTNIEKFFMAEFQSASLRIPSASPMESECYPMRYYSACFFKSGTIVPFFCQPFLYRDTMKDRGQLLQALASAVEKTRKERKLTKTALAHFADLQESYIRGITKGRRNPTVTTIYAICEALDIPPQEFFKRVNAEIDALDDSKSTVPHK